MPAADSMAESPAASFRERAESFVHALHLYGAAGIATFGWAMGQLGGWSVEAWWPLWLCAGLLVYNLDRLLPDPADELNLPRRVAASRRWRRYSLIVAAVSAFGLLVIPLARCDWLTLALVVVGSAVCLPYSLPVARKRWKDWPLLKTFFAPAVVWAAVFGLPLLHEPGELRPARVLPLMLWAGSLLFANMVLCDLRDIEGDRARGVVSVPSRLGRWGTERLMWLLCAGAAGLAMLSGRLAPTFALRCVWLLLAAACPVYLAALITQTRRARSERFYERWVESLLFVPAVVLLASRLFLG